MTTAIEASAALAPMKEPVRKALRAAAKATGVGFDYLATTAQRESSLNPLARAKSSSASGLFQFVDSTWLQTMKEHGAAHGFSKEAGAIRASGQGFSVDDPAMRSRIMDLRFDPEANAMMGAAFTQQNISQLETTLGRQPTGGELYIAHFLGAQGAGKFIQNAQRNPSAPAADAFPQAAAANPSIFYEHGAKRSMSDVYASLTAQHQSAPVQAQQFASLDRKELSLTKVEPGPLYRNMFTPERRSGVSPVVHALWAEQAQAVITANARPGFFPMSKPAESAPEALPANAETAL